MVAEVGAAGLGHLMDADQWKAGQTYSWARICVVQPGSPRTEPSLRTFHLVAASGAHPVSGVFAQLGVCLWDCDCILNFWLCVRLAYLPRS